jgi:hypothetical protein
VVVAVLAQLAGLESTLQKQAALEVLELLHLFQGHL